MQLSTIGALPRFGKLEVLQLLPGRKSLGQSIPSGFIVHLEGTDFEKYKDLIPDYGTGVTYGPTYLKIQVTPDAQGFQINRLLLLPEKNRQHEFIMRARQWPHLLSRLKELFTDLRQYLQNPTPEQKLYLERSVGDDHQRYLQRISREKVDMLPNTKLAFTLADHCLACLSALSTQLMSR